MLTCTAKIFWLGLATGLTSRTTVSISRLGVRAFPDSIEIVSGRRLGVGMGDSDTFRSVPFMSFQPSDDSAGAWLTQQELNTHQVSCIPPPSVHNEGPIEVTYQLAMMPQ